MQEAHTLKEFLSSKRFSEDIGKDVPSYCCDPQTRGFVYDTHGAVIELTNDNEYMLIVENTCEVSKDIAILEKKLFGFLSNL
jgi:hypothetical protein